MSMSLFHNILCDCHNPDVINSLLNAFRLKKKAMSIFHVEDGRVFWPNKGPGGLQHHKFYCF